MQSMVAWAVAAAVQLPCSCSVCPCRGLSLAVCGLRVVLFLENNTRRSPLWCKRRLARTATRNTQHASALPHRPSGSVAHRLTHRRVCGVSVDCEAHASQLASGQQHPQALAETPSNRCVSAWLLLELPASSRAARPRTTPRTQQAHDMKRRDDCLFDLHPTQPGARASELNASLNDKKIMARSASNLSSRQNCTITCLLSQTK